MRLGCLERSVDSRILALGMAGNGLFDCSQPPLLDCLDLANRDRAGMAIRKQEFYEGAALHLLARTGQVRTLKYDPPFFYFNNEYSVMLKYSTRGRSPWTFTFTPLEQEQLLAVSPKFRASVGLICGADGVVALDYTSFCTIASKRSSALHVACYRDHGAHYEVRGPDGTLSKKVPPSGWLRVLGNGSEGDAAS